MAVGHKLRFEIFKRDGFTCQYCGRKPPEVVLNIEHILAIANGGDDHHDNLQTSCRECNSGKSDNPLGECSLPTPDAAERARERAEQLRQLNDAMMSEELAVLQSVNRLGEIWGLRSGQHEGRNWKIPAEFESSTRRFVKMLGIEKVQAAIEVAFSKFPDKTTEADYYNGRFKYYCGICWKMHRDSKA